MCDSAATEPDAPARVGASLAGASGSVAAESRTVIMKNRDQAKPTDGIPGKKRRASKGTYARTGPFYIVAPSPLADELSRVLKHGETFAVFDHYGDIKPAGLGGRRACPRGDALSLLPDLAARSRPSTFLSSTIKEDNDLLAVDLTNPDVYEQDRLAIPRGALHVRGPSFSGKAFVTSVSGFGIMA